jgi:hypothetical protein
MNEGVSISHLREALLWAPRSFGCCACGQLVGVRPRFQLKTSHEVVLCLFE